MNQEQQRAHFHSLVSTFNVAETGHIDHSMLKKYVDDLQSPMYYLAGLPGMVSAMKTMLADAGVSEANIRAEEFTGFNLNEMHPGNAHALFTFKQFLGLKRDKKK